MPVENKLCVNVCVWEENGEGGDQPCDRATRQVLRNRKIVVGNRLVIRRNRFHVLRFLHLLLAGALGMTRHDVVNFLYSIIILYHYILVCSFVYKFRTNIISTNTL